MSTVQMSSGFRNPLLMPVGGGGGGRAVAVGDGGLSRLGRRGGRGCLDGGAVGPGPSGGGGGREVGRGLGAVVGELRGFMYGAIRVLAAAGRVRGGAIAGR